MGLLAPRIAVAQSSSLVAHTQTRASTQPSVGAKEPELRRGYAGWQRRIVSPATKALHRVSMTAVIPEAPKSFKVHDLITIIVREQKKYEADATTDNKKDASIEAALESWFRLHNHKWVQQGFTGGKPEIKASFGGQYKTDGKSEREDKFITRLTAEIVDVKPNGNLVLSATSHIVNDEEEQVMTLSGTCRSFDVTPDNTVLSTQLADLRIEVSHTGAVRDATRRGWIPKALDTLRPF